MRDSLAHPGSGFLQKAALVLLALQVAAIARMLTLGDLGTLPSGFLTVVMFTAIYSAVQGRLAGDPSVQGLGWLFALRLISLLVLTVATLTVVFYRLLPPATPHFAQQALFSAIWVLITLKGAAIGKLRPNGLIGLRVPWTLNSQLAWDKAHRMLGRILFWGGIPGLLLSFVMPPRTSMALWFAVIAFGVGLALIEARTAWRNDSERRG